MFNAMYPDQLDTLQIQIAMIACLFANVFAKKKVGSWTPDDFIPKFKNDQEQKQDPSDIKTEALKMAFAFGNDKTKKWADKKMKDSGVIQEEQEEYKYPLESMIEEKNKSDKLNKLPARLRLKGK